MSTTVDPRRVDALDCPQCGKPLFFGDCVRPDCPGDGGGCPNCGWGCDLEFSTNGKCYPHPETEED